MSSSIVMPPASILAFDTATERLSVALSVRGVVRTHEAAGGSQASAALIPAIRSLLAEAGVGLEQLDAIAFGRGPGAFTGLRTACAVAQGLAFGAAKPVLPIDTLLAIAEDARAAQVAAGRTDADVPGDVWVVMDARMDEVYAARYAHRGEHWETLAAPMLVRPEALVERWRADPPRAVAGNALTVFGPRLDPGGALNFPDAAPRAAAMLPLAQAAWARGEGVDAALALPLYLRDKVALTTAEREAARASKSALERVG